MIRCTKVDPTRPMGPGTLYGTMKRMLEEGLIEEISSSHEGRRKRYYRLTPVGEGVLSREVQRLKNLLGQVKY